MLNQKIEGISWGQMQRLKFIERQILWGRSFNSRMLADSYGISRYQVTKDIKLYTNLCPDNLKPYDPAEKSLRPTNGFKPMLISEDPIEVIRVGGFCEIEGSEVATIPSLNRLVLDGVIPSILSAIDNESDIEAIYASSSSPVGIRRRMHPTTIIFAGNRLHIRAYCYKRDEYRDFVLSRFLTIPRLLDPKKLLPVDDDYNQVVNIELLANPSLSQDGQDLIQREYNLIEHRGVSIRKCLVQYFLRDNALPASENQLNEALSSPWSFPVIANFSNFW